MDVTITIMEIYIIWNILIFFLYGLDKHKAKKKSRRISERMLLVPAVLMGGVGAFLGMQVFRHKTKHLKFKIGVPLAVLFNVLLVFIARVAIFAYI